MDTIKRVKICLLLVIISAGLLLAMDLTGFLQSQLLSTILKVTIVGSITYCAAIMLMIQSCFRITSEA
jgi:hypothetical protein